MRRVALALGCSCAAASAAVPGLGTSFTVTILDEARKPLAAFVVAREFVSIPQLHGSRTLCERADAARAGAGAHEVRLPAAGTSHLVPGRSHAMEAFAYATGYCIERTPSAREAAYQGSFPPSMRSERPPPVSASQDVVLNARRVAGDERRLRYLLGLSTALACGGADWSPRSKEALPQLAQAIGAEADAIAKSRYEKAMVQRLRGQLADVARMQPASYDDPAILAGADASRPFTRDFIVGPANLAIRWPTGNEPPGTIGMAIATKRGTAYSAAVPAQPAGAALSGSAAALVGSGAVLAPQVPPHPGTTGLVVHCRHGAASACDLDERDAAGKTALASYAEELNIEAVEVLLANGANPSAPLNVRDADAFDALVGRIVARPPAAGSNDAAKAVRIFELFAASPKATIRAGLGADIDDSAHWKMAAEASGILLAARDKLRALPRRAEPAAPCPPVELERDDDRLPLRLRGA